jgi:hypothetical protein
MGIQDQPNHFVTWSFCRFLGLLVGDSGANYKKRNWKGRREETEKGIKRIGGELDYPIKQN